MTRGTHALSIDVEDWNNAAVLLASEKVLPPTKDVVTNTKKLFSLISSHGHRATWFFLGEVAEAYPELVRMVVDAGHEIGVHGFHHHRIHTLPRAEYRDSVLRAKDVIEQAGGKAAGGYRAVAASISKETWYVFDVLVEAGFMYDASIFPFEGPKYGIKDAPLGPHWINAPGGGRVFEIPFSVVDVGPLRLPCCGGGYLRHFPLSYTKLALRALKRRNRPAVFYLHPYELDQQEDLRLVPESLAPNERRRLEKLRWAQFRNRAGTEKKLRYLFSNHSFAPIEDVFDVGAEEPGSAS